MRQRITRHQRPRTTEPRTPRRHRRDAALQGLAAAVGNRALTRAGTHGPPRGAVYAGDQLLGITRMWEDHLSSRGAARDRWVHTAVGPFERDARRVLGLAFPPTSGRLQPALDQLGATERSLERREPADAARSFARFAAAYERYQRGWNRYLAATTGTVDRRATTLPPAVDTTFARACEGAGPVTDAASASAAAQGDLDAAMDREWRSVVHSGGVPGPDLVSVLTRLASRRLVEGPLVDALVIGFAAGIEPDTFADRLGVEQARQILSRPGLLGSFVGTAIAELPPSALVDALRVALDGHAGGTGRDLRAARALGSQLAAGPVGDRVTELAESWLHLPMTAAADGPRD